MEIKIDFYQSGSCKFKSAAASIGAKVSTKVNPGKWIKNNDVTTMMTILKNRGVVDIGFSVANPFYNFGY